MKNILMVCLGNICRSPMAEGILRHKAASLNIPVDVDSAGTSNYHIGDHPDHRAVKCLRKHGLDISQLHARQFSEIDFKYFDVIFVMDKSNYRDVLSKASTDDERNKVKLFLNEAWPNENRDVPDPWFGDQDGFEDVYQMLDKAADSFLQSLQK
jgi:protein-tyrosine phosphatase